MITMSVALLILRLVAGLAVAALLVVMLLESSANIVPW